MTYVAKVFATLALFAMVEGAGQRLNGVRSYSLQPGRSIQKISPGTHSTPHIVIYRKFISNTCVKMYYTSQLRALPYQC